ncbi:unnamed protein product [Ambrosiozyma monospora]|uniref:Unnamed protein product n=1 Tax=Ambrosiozyma monospora TaxID=43982 RepID=A0ACB5T7V1_AMBMO|nr:unnamed protein product [Ambrosiozyma monospora]
MFTFAIASAILASTALAHFRIPYPGERNATNWDTQTTGPCGGDNSVVEPRFEWNPEGSPLELFMHHNDSVGAIYFCGKDECSEASDFDTLLYEPYDHHKAGNYCIPAVVLPDDFNKENQTGTIQVIYAGNKEGGSELTDLTFMYNCLDIVVSSDGPIYDGSQCSNSSEISLDQHVDKDINESNVKQLDQETSIAYMVSVAKAAGATASSSGNSSMAMAMSMTASGSNSDSSMSGMSTMTGEAYADMCTMAGMEDMCSSTASGSGSSKTMSGMAGMSASGSGSGSSGSSSSVSSAGAAGLLTAGGVAGLSGLFAALLLL